MVAMDALKEIPKRRVLAEEILSDEGINIDANGTVTLRLPHLRSFMTGPDRVKVLRWHLEKGEVLEVRNDERDLVTLEYLGDDWDLPIPPFLCPMRVAQIVAEANTTIHLLDPLIVFEPIPTGE